MHETTDDLRWLQQVLDHSYAGAGSHLAEIHTGPARVTATDLVGRMEGMQILVLATVSGDGRPLTGPVDGFLYRGRLLFGTSGRSVRARHIEQRPSVSATHVRGETLVVTVHGDARPLELGGEDAGFADVLRAQYPGWDAWEGNPYYRIEPRRMFAADMSVHTAAG